MKVRVFVILLLLSFCMLVNDLTYCNTALHDVSGISKKTITENHHIHIAALKKTRKFKDRKIMVVQLLPGGLYYNVIGEENLKEKTFVKNI